MKFQKEINPDAFNFKHEVQESYVIAVVGAITEVKNQMEVLKALAKLNDTSIKLRFIGEPRSTDKDRNYYSDLLNYAKEKIYCLKSNLLVLFQMLEIS